MNFLAFLQKLLREKLKPFIQDPTVSVDLGGNDVFCVFFISIITFFIRFWNFQHPPNLVFDEIHFGNFTNFYIKGQYFFDIHPPLAKFLIAFIGYLSEYDGSIAFSKIYGKPYPDEFYISLRMTPIIISSLTPVFIYLALRFASFSIISSLTSALLITFDTTSLCESKFILTDGILHFFVALCLAIHNYWLTLNPGTTNYEIWKYITSLSLGCAFSVKYTAMSLCFVIGFTQIVHLFQQADYILDEELYRQVCIRAAQLFLPAISIHIIFWMIHLILIPYAGPDTSKFDIESYHLLNKTNTTDDLVDKSYILQGSFLISRVFNIILSIQFSNAMNYQPHPYMSRPIDWPLLTDVWVGFWSENQMEVDCVGNIFVNYIGFIGVLFGLFAFKKPNWIKGMRFIVGYFMSYLPFFLVPRTMFLYHYIIPLMFAAMSFGVTLDLYFPPFWKGLVVSIALLLAAFGFFFWSPLVYATQLEAESRNIRILNKAWIFGNQGRGKWVKYMHSQFDIIKRRENITQ
ncbi:Dolichyl-phosphate-mannose-protein mannosyltransferase [Tritrichomonas foetus]|uniref:Dolichyl-phosphate-mannose-protein mannosyltransferase n=1 Tax=Tritrichomonas foetus TaxID=1144522 RepID=A0A1J4JM80_9EUKA|nr:Dolichyl-phosphate-mannose-protein mannosyltransferase [Tritrichomonas foetus]|eukprot:OHT00171.1 Dolichyl-phosphate-mannose-protein mannosyltransferase [Tritrichomonas foetus]